MIKLWFTFILLSNVAMMAFASVYTKQAAFSPDVDAQSVSFNEAVVTKAQTCRNDKQAALRVNDVDKYLSLVIDMECARAEIIVSDSHPQG